MNSNETSPSYLALYESGELEKRAVEAVALLKDCNICPQNCGVDRTKSSGGVCHIGRNACVASYFAHMGEETPLRGVSGSGTIFFCQCNLHCVFCQNDEISQNSHAGLPITSKSLGGMMLDLQERGCHNINLVTPDHVVPQVLEALLYAVEGGLSIPLVYNSSSYEKVETLKLLDGIVDIYMPDFKFWNEENSRRYLHAEDYPEKARQAIKEMHRQVGDLHIDENGIAYRGLIVRHLLMPGALDDAEQIIRFISEEISSDTYINIMNQYYPSAQVSGEKFPELNRRIFSDEYDAAIQYARDVGLARIHNHIQ